MAYLVTFQVITRVNGVHLENAVIEDEAEHPWPTSEETLNNLQSQLKKLKCGDVTPARVMIVNLVRL